MRKRAVASVTGDRLDREERRRLIDAFTKVAAEVGYERTSGSEVAAHAGLQADRFYKHFPNEMSCLIAAHDVFVQELCDDVAEATRDEPDWPMKVRRAVATCLECLADKEARARLFAVDAVRAGPVVLERRFAHTSRVAERLREGRLHFPEARGLGETTEWALVAGVAAHVTSYLLAEQGSLLPCLEAELAELLLTPYLGVEEAKRLAAEPAAPVGDQA